MKTRNTTRIVFRAPAELCSGTIYVWDIHVNGIHAGSFVWYHDIPGYAEGFCYGVRNASFSGVASTARRAVEAIVAGCPWAAQGKEAF